MTTRVADQQCERCSGPAYCAVADQGEDQRATRLRVRDVRAILPVDRESACFDHGGVSESGCDHRRRCHTASRSLCAPRDVRSGVDGLVILRCTDCAYEQSVIPDVVLRRAGLA
jgi:hypothetical protein